VGVALLDVNALLALLVENHDFHPRMSQWFAAHQTSGWATCPITEQGFARIISNPNYIKPASKVLTAITLLKTTFGASASHQFWDDDLPLKGMSDDLQKRISGPKQITDAYLLALAMQHKGRLVTFDRRILQLAPKGTAEYSALDILQ
jgi:toxin-antitoxin system PIN domain toxin